MWTRAVLGDRVTMREPMRTLSPVDPPVHFGRWVWARFVAWLLLVGAMIVFAQVSDVTERISAESIRRTLQGYGFWAPAALLAAYLVRPLFLLPISPLWIASGALFGWVEGALWAILGTSLGAAVGFGLARHLGRAFVERRLGTRLGRWARMSPDHGFRTVLALQLTPIVPHDLINSLAGVSRMPYRSFALGSLLGTTPIVFVYAYIGDAVWEIPSPRFWIAVGLLTALTVTMLLWNRKLARKSSNTEATISIEGGGG